MTSAASRPPPSNGNERRAMTTEADLGPAPAFDAADARWMAQALALAERAAREDDEIPVGAVLVGPDGVLLGEGGNRNIGEHDPSAHAEIVAMRAAGRALGNHRLLGCT